MDVPNDTVALYGSDMNMLYGTKNYDDDFGWFSLGLMIMFLVECGLLSWASLLPTGLLLARSTGRTVPDRPSGPGKRNFPRVLLQRVPAELRAGTRAGRSGHPAHSLTRLVRV